jgi:DNA-binding transcriptional ArsR family regulator
MPASPRSPRAGKSAVDADIDADEELWAAVADPSRRRLLDVLVALGEATPTVLARELPFSRQAVAKHLAVLERAGLVESRRQGREVRYVIGAERLAAATQAMARQAARWDQRLAAIKRIAEAIHRQTAEPQRG